MLISKQQKRFSLYTGMALPNYYQNWPLIPECLDSSEQGGYDCEHAGKFEDENLQTECPVCLLIIREPHQVTCCGKRFCHYCIERVKARNQPCPTCKSPLKAYVLDDDLRERINALDVHCCYQKDGCEWTGKLGGLDSHLNKYPQPGRGLNGCQFTEYRCQYCEKKTQRQFMQKHESKNCTKRPYSCEHCHYKSTHDDVVHNHWPVCGSFPVHCPNQCGLELPRQDVDTHIDGVCPLTTISCDFHHVGCTEKLLRKDLPDHLKENLPTHLSLLASSHVKQQAKFRQQQDEILQQQHNINCLEDRITNLVKENKELKSKNESIEYNFNSTTASFAILEAHFSREIQALREENALLKKEFNTLQREVYTKSVRHSGVPLGTLIITMPNFTAQKKSLDIWYSFPFYTHDQGYKLCLGVYPNVPSKSLSVFIYFMRGEFDDTLKWPFRGAISFRLLDQAKGVDHRAHRVVYEGAVDASVCSRVTERERAEKGQGKQRFITHSELEPKYLQHHTLLFQIYDIELH